MSSYKLSVNPEYSEFEAQLLAIRQVFDACDTSIHKARNEIKLFQYSGAEMVIKSFKVPGGLRSFIYSYLRQSKARRSYDYSLLLGDFAPKPVGYIEFYAKGLLRDSYYVSEKFEYDHTIREPLAQKNFDRREQVFAAFAQFTYQLHENNICHQDYSPGNILFRQLQDGYEFKVVDVNRMRFMDLNLQQRAENLCKLWADDDDLRQIAELYAGIMVTDADEFVQLALQYSHKHKAGRQRKARIKKRLGLY